MEERFDLVVVGGGVIGLSCARQALRDGLSVVVLERGEPGLGATHAAAGMLAPDLETEPGASAMVALTRRSFELWPSFAAELEQAAGLDVGFERSGTLFVALDRDELEAIDWKRDVLERMGVEAPRLAPAECRSLEPGLAPGCAGGLLVPHEAQVDPRRVVGALLSALGDRVRAGADVRSVEPDGVVLADGSRVRARRVLVAAGAWSGVDGLARLRLPVRPLKGQIVRLRGPRPCERIVRSERVYVVPRASGEVVVGATVEERGFDGRVTAGGVFELLREAYRALPEIAELELVDISVGFRPGSPDNAPLLGELDGVLVASGHHRNGILLAPVTAEAIGALLRGDPLPEAAAPFAAARFAA